MSLSLRCQKGVGRTSRKVSSEPVSISKLFQVVQKSWLDWEEGGA